MEDPLMLNALVVGLALTLYPNAKQQMLLEEGMTMRQALDRLGDPDTVESKTCGSKTKQPWTCRVWTYAGGGQWFLVYFVDVEGTWRINAWSST